MADRFHTLSYPAAPAAPRTGLAFPSMPPGARRTYTLDLAAWLADAGSTLAGVGAACDPSLTVAATKASGTAATVVVTGGDSSVPCPVIALTLTLEGGDIELVNVAQPVLALSPALAPVTPPIPALADDAGSRLADDLGAHLLVA